MRVKLDDGLVHVVAFVRGYEQYRTECNKDPGAFFDIDAGKENLTGDPTTCIVCISSVEESPARKVARVPPRPG